VPRLMTRRVIPLAARGATASLSTVARLVLVLVLVLVALVADAFLCPLILALLLADLLAQGVIPVLCAAGWSVAHDRAGVRIRLHDVHPEGGAG